MVDIVTLRESMLSLASRDPKLLQKSYDNDEIPRDFPGITV